MKRITILYTVLLFLFLRTELNATIRYVKNANGGNASGSSWLNASNDLQLIIDQSASGDEVWVASGYYRPVRLFSNTATISLNNRQNSFVLKNGVKVYGGFFGNETLLSQRSWQSNQTYLDGDIGTYNDSSDNCYSVVRSIGAVGDALLDGFLVRNGNADGGAANLYSGGGIYIYQSSPSIRNCRFIDNRALNGGALYCGNGSAPTIANCEFQSNTAIDKGGAVSAYIPGSYKMSRCWFGGNKAASGGAIANEYGTSTVSISLKNCVFQGNYASAPGNSGGGAVYNYTDIHSQYVNCTFAGNRAASYGGAIFTISNGTDSLKNCIVWGNQASTSGNNLIDTFGATLTVAYSIIEGGSGGTGNSASHPGFIFPRPASFAPTLSGNYRLLPCSPAVDSGNNAYLTANDNLDFWGNARIQHTYVDKGAYELTQQPITPDSNGVVFVKSNNSTNGNGSTWTNATRELADALSAARSNTAIQEIWVTSGTYLPLYDALSGCTGAELRNRSFVIPGGVKVYGGFAGNETAVTQRSSSAAPSVLEGDLGLTGDTLFKVFHVAMMINNAAGATLDGFTLRNGYANSTTFNIINGHTVSHNDAGALFILQSNNVNVKQCRFENNYGIACGAVKMANTSGTISNSVFTQNRGQNTGALGVVSQSSVTVENTNFSANQATFRTVHNLGGTSRFSNCIFSGNQLSLNYNVTGKPGILDNTNGGLCTIVNSVFSGNTEAPGNYTKVITSNQGNTSVKNSIVWGNTDQSSPVWLEPLGGGQMTVSNSIVQGGYTGTGNLNITPLFINAPAPASAPFTTGDYRVPVCSPAINAGNNTFLLASDTLDMAGNKRIKEMTVDIGAYEYSGARPDAAGIVYVDSSKAAGGTGNSWVNAVNELAIALKAAKYDTAIHQIWIAKGTYKPMFTADSMLCNSAAPRNKAFVMVSGLRLYGGFTGTESMLSQRNSATNKTVLSGDIGLPNDITDNCFHVLIAANLAGNDNRIDGLTITGGYNTFANFNDTLQVNETKVYKHMGAGIHLTRATLNVINCTVSGNSGYTGGGVAFYGHGYFTDPVSSFTNCIISGNVATNSAYPGGAGIYRFSSWGTVNISNCTVTGNRAEHKGGAFAQTAVQGGVTHIVNSVFWLNDGIAGDDNLDTAYTSDIVMNTCIIEGGYPHGTQILNGHPGFFTALNPVNAPSNAGDFRLGVCSPAINAGNNGLLTAGNTTAVNGLARILESRVDIGAFEQTGMSLPATPGDSIVAPIYCTDLNSSYMPYDNWYNFIQQNTNKLVVGIRDSATFLSLSTPVATGKLRMQYGSNTTTLLQNPFGQTGYFYPINRSWTFTTTTLPANPVSMRFYISAQDSMDISGTNFGSLQNLIVYKVNGTHAYNPAATGYKQYTYAATADTSHFTIGKYQGITYVEFKVTGFSSGSIAFVAPTPLEIQLGDFTGLTAGKRNRLDWHTLKEEPGDYFEIERSSNARDFTTLAAQTAKGTTSAAYTYWDEEPLPGRNFYRLKMLDQDGGSHYSKVIQLFTDKSSAVAISLYPNPAKNKVRVMINAPSVPAGTLTVMDMSGKILLRQAVTSFIEHLDMQQFAAGIYEVRYTGEQGTCHLKCVKE